MQKYHDEPKQYKGYLKSALMSRSWNRGPRSTHQGPAPASFSEPTLQPDIAAAGLTRTTVTFSEAGEYLLLVRADNFNRVDSTPRDQCCWTNGYVKVTVSP